MSSLVSRGVPMLPPGQDSDSLFDSLPEHKQRAIELLVLGDPEVPGKRIKVGVIAEECGVDPYSLYRWRRDPEFQAARKEFRERVGKSEMVDEAVATLRRQMRNKDSTHAAEVLLKFAGEMVEKREVTGQMTTKTQIDLQGAPDTVLIERIHQLQKQLGMKDITPEDITVEAGAPDVEYREIVRPEYRYVDSDEDNSEEETGEIEDKNTTE